MGENPKWEIEHGPEFTSIYIFNAVGQDHGTGWVVNVAGGTKMFRIRPNRASARLEESAGSDFKVTPDDAVLLVLEGIIITEAELTEAVRAGGNLELKVTINGEIRRLVIVGPAD